MRILRKAAKLSESFCPPDRNIMFQWEWQTYLDERYLQIRLDVSVNVKKHENHLFLCKGMQLHYLNLQFYTCEQWIIHLYFKVELTQDRLSRENKEPDHHLALAAKRATQRALAPSSPPRPAARPGYTSSLQLCWGFVRWNFWVPRPPGEYSFHNVGKDVQNEAFVITSGIDWAE